jgi:hypothetical protein
MAGWSKERADTVKAAFYEFLSHTWVKSKEKGWIILGENLYGAQTGVIDGVFDGLSNDIHDFKILKSRQLGVSTIVRALMAFWTGAFEVTASLVFDTSQHLQEAREELVEMMERFPPSFEFPRITGNNRYYLKLSNKSRINLSSAGVKETKSSGTLGRGSAVAVAHRSELCSYENVAGIEAYKASLARKNPNRLFIDESTARGFNIWNEIWDDAKKDHHAKCLFFGWWSHPEQKIDKDDPDFAIYGSAPLTDREKAKIKSVYEKYGHTITAEQVAWIRREMNPSTEDDGDAAQDRDGNPLKLQEQPWDEDDAFQMTGAVFFDPECLTTQMNKNASKKYKTYSFAGGIEFTEFKCYPAPNVRSVELKVWEEPVEGSVYVVAADVAFGHNEHNDRSAVQVLRCYADGIDQVAEYAWPLINSRTFAWVIVALEAWYAGETSEIYRIVELNGPGESTWMELQSLKHQMARGYFGNQLAERGLANIQRNVRNYIYTRADAMSPGRNYQWKTNGNLKVSIFERCRDFTANGMIRLRSADTLEEMRSITRDGDSIEAAGSKKDDRVFAIALGVRCWDERVRRLLINSRRTRANEEAKRRMSVQDQVAMFQQNMFDGFLAGQSMARRRALQAAKRRQWRSGT